MGFLEAVRHCFSHYAVFSGRASRSEYWYFMLFNFIVATVLDVTETVMGGSDPFIMNSLFSIAAIAPSASVLVRRLHDVNRSGWWWWIVFTVIGIIPAYYWLVRASDKGENRFGPAPVPVEPAPGPAPGPIGPPAWEGDLAEKYTAHTDDVDWKNRK